MTIPGSRRAKRVVAWAGVAAIVAAGTIAGASGGQPAEESAPKPVPALERANQPDPVSDMAKRPHWMSRNADDSGAGCVQQRGQRGPGHC